MIGVMYFSGRAVARDDVQAVEWWQKGEVDKVREYCLEDVRLTKELYDYALKHGILKYRDLRDVKDIKMDTGAWGMVGELPALTHALPI